VLTWHLSPIQRASITILLRFSLPLSYPYPFIRHCWSTPSTCTRRPVFFPSQLITTKPTSPSFDLRSLRSPCPHSSTRSLRSRDSFNRTKAGTVSDATYIAYMVIMLVGWVACLGLIPSHLVRRSDGSHAAPHPREVGDQLSWWQKFSRVAVREARHIYALKDEWRIWVGLPFSHFFRSHTDKGRS
jgi:hypothetical protein